MLARGWRYATEGCGSDHQDSNGGDVNITRRNPTGHKPVTHAVLFPIIGSKITGSRLRG